jgi:hypothetical protein
MPSVANGVCTLSLLADSLPIRPEMKRNEPSIVKSIRPDPTGR